MRQAYDYWQDQPGVYNVAPCTHEAQSNTACDQPVSRLVFTLLMNKMRPKHTSHVKCIKKATPHKINARWQLSATSRIPPAAVTCRRPADSVQPGIARPTKTNCKISLVDQQQTVQQCPGQIECQIDNNRKRHFRAKSYTSKGQNIGGYAWGLNEIGVQKRCFLNGNWVRGGA